MMPAPLPRWFAVLLVLPALAAGGCALFQPDPKLPEPVRFRPLPPEQVSQPPQNGGEVEAYTVNAMIGQVSGQPLYASTILDPIAAQLGTWGAQLPPQEFVRTATPLIRNRLEQVVVTTLILHDAEQDMDSREQAMLRGMVAEHRRETIRTRGQGSELLAERAIREDTGGLFGLDDYLDEYRKATIIRRYNQKHLMPRIVVSRRMIERYYETHPDEFRSPARRKLRLIRAADQAQAARVSELLAAGTPFIEVAGHEANNYKRSEAGIFGEDGWAEGDAVFSGQLEVLSDAMKRLAAGQHSPPIQVGAATWWLFVEEMTPAREETLTDAQHRIRDKLRQQVFMNLTMEYRDELLGSGRFDSMERMTLTLVDVAMGRYLKSQ